MGSEQLTVLEEGGPAGTCALFPAVQGSAHEGEKGISWHMRNGNTLQQLSSLEEGASWRLRTLNTALQSLLCDCASLAASRKI